MNRISEPCIVNCLPNDLHEMSSIYKTRLKVEFEGIDNYLQKRTRILFAVAKHQVQIHVIVLWNFSLI